MTNTASIITAIQQLGVMADDVRRQDASGLHVIAYSSGAFKELSSSEDKDNPRALKKEGSRNSDLLSVSDKDQQAVMEKVSNDIRKNYSKKILEKLEIITRNALKHLTKFFSSSVVESLKKTKFDFEEDESLDYSFILTTFLAIPEIEVMPNIEQIQAILVKAGNFAVTVVRKKYP